MPTKVIKVRAHSLKLAETQPTDKDAPEEWELQFGSVMVEPLVMRSNDLTAARKLIGKLVEARVTIGADEEAAPATGDAAKLKADLDAATALVERQHAELEQLKSAGPVVDVAARSELKAALEQVKALEMLARGKFQVLLEQARAHREGTDKSTYAAKFADLERIAREGLDKLETLVPRPKQNGKAAVEAGPAGAA